MESQPYSRQSRNALPRAYSIRASLSASHVGNRATVAAIERTALCRGDGRDNVCPAGPAEFVTRRALCRLDNLGGVVRSGSADTEAIGALGNAMTHGRAERTGPPSVGLATRARALACRADIRNRPKPARSRAAADRRMHWHPCVLKRPHNAGHGRGCGEQMTSSPREKSRVSGHHVVRRGPCARRPSFRRHCFSLHATRRQAAL